MYHIFSIQSSVDDGHLGCFQVLAVVNSAAVNTVVHASFLIQSFVWIYAQSGIAGAHDNWHPCLKHVSIHTHIPYTAIFVTVLTAIATSLSKPRSERSSWEAAG